MKKTLTANISGTVFHIEEDAYEQLNRYLNTIRSQFGGTHGREEIMADIEARIAELFQERMDGRQVVTVTEVEHVIAIMGQPEDYVSELDDSTGGSGSDAEARSGATHQGKRLYRDPDDKWVGGVLGGVAAYFNIDPLILRLIYLAALFLGFGFLLYFILWIVVPEAQTSAEKLRMRGEEVNVENLKRMFDEGSETIRKGADKVATGAREAGARVGSTLGRNASGMGSTLATGLVAVIKVLGKVLGFALLGLGAVLAILLTVAFFGQYEFIMGGEKLAEGTTLQDLALLLFNSPGQLKWAWIAGAVAVIVPIAGLLYGGISLLFGVGRSKWFAAVLVPLWVSALIVLAIIGTRIASDFSRREVNITEIAIDQPVGQTITIAAMDDPHFGHNTGHRNDDLELIKQEGDRVIVGWADMDVEQSPDSLFHLVVKRKARGRGSKTAGRRAMDITYTHAQQDSILRLAPWFSFPAEQKFRGQQVHFTLQVPIGRGVHFAPNAMNIIWDVENVTNTLDRDMIGKTWTMTSGGLSDAVRPEEVPDDIRPRTVPMRNARREEVPRETERVVRKAYAMPDLIGALVLR